MKKLFPLILTSLSATCLGLSTEVIPEKVSFNEHIRPIFSNTCFNCHGPDEHESKAHLQLHTFEAATQPRTYKKNDGSQHTKEAVIVPGHPDQSAVWDRISSTDPDDIMPPSDFHHSLTDRDKTMVKKWIEQGAKYQSHWAYEPVPIYPQMNIPATLDAMVNKKILEKGFQTQNGLESKEVLIRRLSLDLRGLLPTKEEMETFMKDTSEHAWEKLVDQFLASKNYGERMGVHWFDLVRYSNSVGFHGDQENYTAPYRDYVINAFNDNMRYDQFSKEQLAGDLLENPTQQQLIATAYNRLNKVTKEGGAQAGEYLSKYAADRVSNISSVWLGSTLQCAECHHHKYDPFTTEDFYSMAAFFADVKQVGVYNNFNGQGLGNDGNFPPRLVILPAAQKDRLERSEKALKELKEQEDNEFRKLQKKLKDTTTDVELKKELQAKVDAHTKKPYSEEFKTLEKEIKQLLSKADLCVITESQEPVITRVLPRGNWMDTSGKVVQPAVPHFLNQIKKEGRATRLDLADWLCSENNPMAARSFINRIWAMYFGKGLSQVTEDLGSQGELPINLELLDFLARRFIDSGWNVKTIIKGIVMSKTYRLSTKRSPDIEQLDPYNRYLTRQSILRLNAEFIRDTALQVSGLLNDKMGGRNIMPYQPNGYYASMNFNPFKYIPESDDEQYRRAVYMHWQRTFLHPFLKNFDAPEREVGICSRTSSNTPLQALTLLNDPTFVEAAKMFSERTLCEGGKNQTAKIQWMFQTALGRNAAQVEIEMLEKLLQSQLHYFKTHPEATKSFLDTGNKKVSNDHEPHLIAAWAQVARTMMNTHEFIVRR